MGTEIKDGKICVDIWDMICNLSKDDKLYLIDTLSCHDDVIHMVADQLVYGYTNDGSNGGMSYDPSSPTVLEKYKRLVAKSASDVAKKEIERLEYKIKELKEDNHKLSKYTWRIYHAYKFKTCPTDIIKGKTIDRWRQRDVL